MGSPTESEESVEVKKGQQPQTQKSKKKRKKRKNKRSRTDSHESDNEKPDTETSKPTQKKSVPKPILASNDIEHRRRRKSSRGEDEAPISAHTPRSVRWEPELVLEP